MSLVVSVALIVWTKSPWGDLLSSFTDHVHHSRATWTFLHVGVDVYKRPFGETGASVPFPQQGITWATFPVAYPPGMFVVFLPVALLGGYVPLAFSTYCKIAIAYLTLIMHVALWRLTPLFQRVGSQLWTAVLVIVWIFSVRASLLGMYDGAWLLTSALGVHALSKGEHGNALLWFVASALLSYRAAAVAPLGLLALIRLWQSNALVARKLAFTAVAAAAGAIVVGAFLMLLRYSPRGDGALHGVDSALLPISYRGYLLVGSGLAAAAFVGYSTSVWVGACVALSTALSILHAGHTWHGFLCFSPLLAMCVTARRPLVAQIVLALWFAFFLQFAFQYSPFRVVEELIRFTEYNGAFIPLNP